MSTRCQVKVVQEGLDWGQEITLYHHTNGYPENMIPTIARAFGYKGKYEHEEWIKGRAGKVASLLCWANPGVFEPEDGHKLHFDIDYYYIVHCDNQGSIREMPIWIIDVYETKDGFWDNPIFSELKPLHLGVEIRTLLETYPPDQL